MFANRWFVFCAVIALSAVPRASGDNGGDFFEKKVRPILVDHCHKCHTGDKVKGNLRLDSRAGMVKGGDNGPAIVPGDPENSLLVKAVRYADDLRMPPRSKLTAEQITDLAGWIKMGAPWPATVAPKGGAIVGPFDIEKRKSEHWAWQPIRRIAPPARKAAVNPIDAFILDRLHAAGLSPAPPADRTTLVRRVYFDLVGLPPSPDEIQSAVNDPSDEWYEKLVERLLASPQYGERWARHWLDLVRFAETFGHEFDFEIPAAWQYRDYVVRAFNADVPYDRLVIEHVAGDLLEKPRRHPVEKFNESILGTGFWFLGEAKHSPVDLRGDEADRIDNMIDVFSKTFLGLTLSCARCHDHKFDAISTKDYYALVGYIQSSRYQQAFIDDPELAGTQRQQLEQLQSQIRRLSIGHTAGPLLDRAGHLAAYMLAGRKIAAGLDKVDNATCEKWIKAMAASRAGSHLDHFFFPWTILDDVPDGDRFDQVRLSYLNRLKTQAGKASDFEKRAVVFADFARDSYRDWFVTGTAFGTAPTREPIPLFSPDRPGTIRHVVPPGIGHSGLVSGKLQGALRSPTFTITRKKILYQVAGKGAEVRLIIGNLQLIRDPIYGGLTFKVDHGDALQWKAMDVGMWVGHKAYIEVIDDGPGFAALGKVLFTDEPALPPASPNYAILQMLDDSSLASADRMAGRYQDLVVSTLKRWQSGELRDDPDRLEILNGILEFQPLHVLPAPEGKMPDKLAELVSRYRQTESTLPVPRRAPAIMDGTPSDERVYIRGNPRTLGELVPRRFLDALRGAGQSPPKSGSGRLDLARQLVDPANPLTARVMVNRLWKHHFGEGIVKSVDNFGVLGELPSHPELLDWLASEFTASGWSIKHMHRVMVFSNTYRMASQVTPNGGKAAEVDPQNRLLHRMPIRRLEAESIRDAMLAVSGSLDRSMGGPGVLPHLTPHMGGRGRPGKSGPLDGDGRRSIYINVRRNFLTPMFLAFDYPIPFSTMGKRSVSNVPAQALILLNNPFVVQQAELWAKRALAEPNLTTTQRVTRLYLSAFARPPDEQELADSLAFLEEQGRLRGGPGHPQAWADLCHVLFNVKEFIFIN